MRCATRLFPCLLINKQREITFLPGSDSIPPSFLTYDLVLSKRSILYLRGPQESWRPFPLVSHNKQTNNVSLPWNHPFHSSSSQRGRKKSNGYSTKEGKSLKFTASSSYMQLICSPQCLCIEHIKG